MSRLLSELRYLEGLCFCSLSEDVLILSVSEASPSSDKYLQVLLHYSFSKKCITFCIGGGGGGGGWGQWVWASHGKSQKYSSLAILAGIPWKITKLSSQHSMTGHRWPASEMPFKWRFASRPIIAPACSGIWILFPPYQLKKRRKKMFSELS